MRERTYLKTLFWLLLCCCTKESERTYLKTLWFLLLCCCTKESWERLSKDTAFGFSKTLLL